MHRIVQIQRSRRTSTVFQKKLQLRLNNVLLLRPVIKFQTKQLFEFDKSLRKLRQSDPIACHRK